MINKSKINSTHFLRLACVLIAIIAGCKKGPSSSLEGAGGPTACDSAKAKLDEAQSKVTTFDNLSRQIEPICTKATGIFDPTDNGCSCKGLVRYYDTFSINKFCEKGVEAATSVAPAVAPIPAGGSQTEGAQAVGTQAAGSQETLQCKTVNATYNSSTGNCECLEEGEALSFPPNQADGYANRCSGVKALGLADGRTTTRADLLAEVESLNKAYQACLAANPTPAAQTTDNCARVGGKQDGSGTCRCDDGFPVFKLGAESCQQHLSKQSPSCTAAGGFISTDSSCRCFPDFEPLPAGQAACSQKAQVPSSRGACVFVEIATKAVQATCGENSDGPTCDSMFATYYQNNTVKYSHQIIAGKTCEAAKASLVVAKPTTRANDCGFVEPYVVAQGPQAGSTIARHQMQRGIDGSVCRDYQCPSGFFTSANNGCVFANGAAIGNSAVVCKSDEYKTVMGTCIAVDDFETKFGTSDEDIDGVFDRFDVCPNTPFDKEKKQPVNPVHKSGRFIGCSGGQVPVR